MMTADELLRLPHDARYELVRGELRKRDFFGALDGAVIAAIIGSLGTYVRQHRLGQVCASVGVVLGRDPDTVYGPPVAFIREERVVDTDDCLETPPDVVFEIDSNIEETTREWLRAGTRVVVIVDPQNNTVRIHRAGSTTTPTDAIEIDDLLPGWRLPLADLFA
jgi:Uma2 family endonuclease